MNLLLCASAWLAISAPASGPLTINVDANSGDTISGEKDFRVTVSSTDTITINQVEFYVGDELRDTETSTPYHFPFDTVDEADGDVKVRFKAYTDQNKTVEKVLTLHVDNEKSKGADYHVNLAKSDLSDSKFQAALDQGRIAMKIDPSSNGARYVLARANLSLKVFDKAQKYAEDLVSKDPKNDSGYQLLAAIDAERAFNTFAKPGADRADVLSSIGDAFAGSVNARKKSLDLEVDSVGAATDANILQYADAAIRAQRYSLAIEALQDRFGANPKNLKLLNRLAYAEIRAERYQDAIKNLSLAQTQGSLDAYGFALLAVAQLQVGNADASTAAMKSAIESDPDDLGVRTAQTFIALKQSKASALSGLATDLGRDEGQRPIVNYYLMALADRQQRFGDARRYFEKAVLTEPALPDVWVEEANYSLGQALELKSSDSERTRFLDLAKLYYQTALVARPESVDALAGIAVLNLINKNVTAAVSFAEAARNAAPEEAAGHYVVAAAYQAAGRLNDARDENDKAGSLDTINLQGRQIPDGSAVYRYLVGSGRIPVIAAPQS